MKIRSLGLGVVVGLMLAGCPAGKSAGNTGGDGDAAGSSSGAGGSGQSGSAGSKSSGADGGITNTGSAGNSSTGGTGGATATADGGSANTDGGAANAGAGGGTGSTDCALTSQACSKCYDSMCSPSSSACYHDTTCRAADHVVSACICDVQSTGAGTIDACVSTFKSAGGQLATTFTDCVVAMCGTICGVK